MARMNVGERIIILVTFTAFVLVVVVLAIMTIRHWRHTIRQHKVNKKLNRRDL